MVLDNNSFGELIKAYSDGHPKRIQHLTYRKNLSILDLK
jgi:hypothetical protein